MNTFIKNSYVVIPNVIGEELTSFLFEYLKNKKRKTIKVDLNPGDILLYKGCDVEHWRDPFEGTLCAQVFLHYNERNNETVNTKFDGRAMLGIPHETKNI